MFNESEHKSSTTIIKVLLKRKEEDLLNSWEISNFINQFSNFYYKEELINTIALALNAQISPNQIFIMDQSFALNNSYSRVGILDLENIEDLKCLYHLGNPSSLIPNSDIFVMKLIFMQFRQTNEILYAHNVPRLSKEKLSTFMTNVEIRYAQNIFGIIRDEAYILLRGSRQQLNEEEYKRCSEKILTLHKNITKESTDLSKNEVLIRLLEKEIMNGSFRNDEKHYDYIEEKYFNDFYRQLNNLSRPVVGIYYKDINKVQIICNSHINKNERDNRFLDFQEITHKSPLTISIVGGVSLLVPTIVGFQACMLQKKANELEKQIADGEKHLTRIGEEFNKNFEELMKSKEVNPTKDVSNLYLHGKISEIKSDNLQKGNEYISKYGFSFEEAKVEAVNQ